MALRLLAALVAAPLLAALPAASAQEGRCVEELRIIADQDAMTVTLSWDPVPGASAYHVHRQVDGGEETVEAVLPATETSFHQSVPGGVVEYRVGVDGHPAPDCPTASVHIHGPHPPHAEPECATGLVAEAAADGRVLLAWSAVPGAEAYEVLRAIGEGALAPHAVVPADETAFADEDVEAGVTYRYAVAANGIPEEACEEAVVTAIPFFPGAVAAALASVAAVGAFRLARRA